jgi:hypothetical protein
MGPAAMPGQKMGVSGFDCGLWCRVWCSGVGDAHLVSSSNLKMEVKCSSKSSVNFCRITRRNVLEGIGTVVRKGGVMNALIWNYSSLLRARFIIVMIFHPAAVIVNRRN